MNSSSSITSSDWLNQATIKLSGSNDPSARLDALLLLTDELNIDKVKVLSSEFQLTQTNLNNLNTMLARRIKHEPMAYIRGFCEFYGNIFFVNNCVLVPRSESESFLNLFNKIYNPTKHKSVLDLGCGSGCIGLSLKLAHPKIVIHLTDLSQDAILVAQKNASMLKVDAKFKASNLFNDLSNRYDIVVANLPYVPINYKVNIDTSYEPKMALFSGVDGLDLYAQMWNQLNSFAHKPEFVFTESLISQHDNLEGLAITADYQLVDKEGLVQVYRLTTKY
jgi:release factor glutamine methyltransferase